MIPAMRTDLVRIGQLAAIESIVAIRTFNKNALGADGLFLVALLLLDLRFVSAKPGHILYLGKLIEI